MSQKPNINSNCSLLFALSTHTHPHSRTYCHRTHVMRIKPTKSIQKTLQKQQVTRKIKPPKSALCPHRSELKVTVRRSRSLTTTMEVSTSIPENINRRSRSLSQVCQSANTVRISFECVMFHCCHKATQRTCALISYPNCWNDCFSDARVCGVVCMRVLVSMCGYRARTCAKFRS